jgi:hypothetical protein
MAIAAQVQNPALSAVARAVAERSRHSWTSHVKRNLIGKRSVALLSLNHGKTLKK